MPSPSLLSRLPSLHLTLDVRGAPHNEGMHLIRRFAARR